MHKLLIVLLAVVSSTHVCYAQSKTGEQKNKSIHNVLNIFMQSIIKKDTATLASLFVKDVPIAWIDVQSRETLVVSKKTYAKATGVESADYKGFIKYIGNSKDALEEKFYNVKIRTDGLIASVNFNYSFWSNGLKENWGQENWELVFNGTGWKIAGVYFSYTLQSVATQP